MSFINNSLKRLIIRCFIWWWEGLQTSQIWMLNVGHVGYDKNEITQMSTKMKEYIVNKNEKSIMHDHYEEDREK